jgi:hypothetical protein
MTLFVRVMLTQNFSSSIGVLADHSVRSGGSYVGTKLEEFGDASMSCLDCRSRWVRAKYGHASVPIGGLSRYHLAPALIRVMREMSIRGHLRGSELRAVDAPSRDKERFSV